MLETGEATFGFWILTEVGVFSGSGNTSSCGVGGGLVSLWHRLHELNTQLTVETTILFQFNDSRTEGPYP